MVKIYKSDSRGYFDHGWLKTSHSFSFGAYNDPERVRFGTLRVLNDDYIDPGVGFGLHPHENMEIISVILDGQLAHKDSKGNEHVSSANGIQVMSAGTGIYHSEYNASQDEVCNLLQLWIFPDKRGHTPRYDQSIINGSKIINNAHLFVGPTGSNANLFINQNAYLSMLEIDNSSIEYKLYDKDNGVYLFVIEGNCEINETGINRRDAISFTDTEILTISSNEKAKLLIIEVPLIDGE